MAGTAAILETKPPGNGDGLPPDISLGTPDDGSYNSRGEQALLDRYAIEMMFSLGSTAVGTERFVKHAGEVAQQSRRRHDMTAEVARVLLTSEVPDSFEPFGGYHGSI